MSYIIIDSKITHNKCSTFKSFIFSLAFLWVLFIIVFFYAKLLISQKALVTGKHRIKSDAFVWFFAEKLNLTDASIKYGKKFIRKKAIESIREKLEFAQKDEGDFTKEQMRKMISKEEKKIIKSFGVRGAMTTILALFGITNF